MREGLRHRSVTALPDGGSGGPGEPGPPRGADYVALAAALAARDADIVVACQERYRQALEPGEGTGWLRDPLWNVTSLGTLSIVRWLQTGELANFHDRSKIAEVGMAAAHERELVAREFAVTLDPTGLLPAEPEPEAAPAARRLDERRAHGSARLSVTMLTKLNFWWSDVTCGVLRQEGTRLGVDDAVVEEARAMVVRSAHASLIDMAKRFDAEIEALHRRLADLALRDPLTGLCNRMVLIDQLERALARLERQPAGLAVVFVDVDDFKAVNDVYGHACGDAVLVELAGRLSAAVRPGDVVARLGGDEFVVLLEGLASPAATAPRHAERLRAAASEPLTVGEERLAVTVSAGVAAVQRPGRRSEDVLAEADAAMYRAKRAGRNRVSVVQVDDGSGTVRVATTSGLHRALERQELRLVYQPIYDWRHRTLAGFEALLRWEHPERGTVSPLEFVPIAEESGLMVPIGEWVLEEACRQAMAWAPAMGGPPRMAVNVSARQLDDREFVRRVTRILERTGLPPGALMLEITETVLLGEDLDHEATLAVLKDLGVQLAIDDFGTGYSSLAYLRRFPVDQLKVDRSFVKDVAEHGDTRILRAVVRLAHDLGLEVVAEGVETSDELDVVKELGCDVVQGFLLGRPVPASSVALEQPAAII